MVFRTRGGDKRDRTADLLNAIQALSQPIRLHTPARDMEALAGGIFDGDVDGQVWIKIWIKISLFLTI